MAAKSKTKGRAKSSSRGVDQRLVKALAHEMRVEILAILNERMASPNELANELGEGLSQVSYHVNVLKENGCIELVRTEPRRGAVEHYYRATSRAFLTDGAWQELPASLRKSLSADVLGAIVDDAVAALEGDTFDSREDRHLSWTPLTVDEQGWGELTETLAEALKRVLAIQAESAKRLARDEREEGIPASVAVLSYQVPASSTKKPPKKKAKASGKA